MHSVPAREYHIWIQKTGTRKQFFLHMLSKNPAVSEHHQIELVSILHIFLWLPSVHTCSCPIKTPNIPIMNG